MGTCEPYEEKLMIEQEETALFFAAQWVGGTVRYKMIKKSYRGFC